MQISKRWFQIAFEIRRSQFDFRPGRKFALMKIHTRWTSASIFHRVVFSALPSVFNAFLLWIFNDADACLIFRTATCFVASWWRGKKKDLYWEPLAQRITINRYPFAYNQRRNHVTLNCAYFIERIPVVRLRLSFDLTWGRKILAPFYTRSSLWFKSISI